MQLTDFLHTAQWITNQISSTTREIIFEQLATLVSHSQSEPRVSQIVIKASHELTLIRERFKSHPFAPAVLTAFGLEILLDESFPLRVHSWLIRNVDSDQETEQLLNLSVLLRRNWMIFTQCREPIESLLVPKQVLQEKDFDETLTITVPYAQNSNLAADSLVRVLTNVNQVYAALARLHGENEFPPLRVIYISSGSTIRVDLRGLGEPIKRIKELLIEGWNLIRFREVEDFRSNNKGLLEGLKTIREINSMREKGELPEEDALRLSKQVLDSAAALLQAGALPREVQKVEIIENQKILDEFQRKLLPPAPADVEDASGKKKRSVKHRAKPTRKGSRKSKKQ